MHAETPSKRPESQTSRDWRSLECAAPIAIQLRDIAKWVSLLTRKCLTLCQFELTPRDLKLALVVICLTYGRGRREVWLSEDKILPALTGIRADNLPSAFARLDKYNIVKRERRGSGYWYRFQPNAKKWWAPQSKDLARIREISGLIKHNLDQAEIQFRSDTELDDQIEADDLEAAVADAQRDNGVIETPYAEGSEHAETPHGVGLSEGTRITTPQAEGLSIGPITEVEGNPGEEKPAPHTISSLAPRNVYTSNVPDIKRGTCTRLSRDADEEKCRDAVLAFVGPTDYHKNWGRPSNDAIFTDDRPALIAAFNYLTAGLASGEVRIQKTKGAALYDGFKRERDTLYKKQAARQS
jgi:hypothetical protein